jgi:small subunit ribosomal protein S11
MAKKKQKKKKKKKKRQVIRGIAYIKATFNNTIITITDPSGDVLVTASAGSIGGFKGSRKSTPFAATLAGETAGEKARKMGMIEVDVRVKGPGSGRENAVSGLHSAGLKILSIGDITPIPHNGCRPRKKRRI